MIEAVIFDLDGVIVSTDEFHYQAWKKLSDEEGIYFDRHINERLRGVSRLESLDIIMEKATKNYTEDEKKALAERKNNYYRELLNSLSPKDILPGVMEKLNHLKKAGIKLGIGSSSRNTPVILEKIGLSDFFNAISDGNQIKKSKPDPEVFLLAASKLNVSPARCLVVEDADAGVEAAINAGMKCLAVGSASSNPKANISAENLNKISVSQMLKL
jgi:beta-phosphoglucomutase